VDLRQRQTHLCARAGGLALSHLSIVSSKTIYSPSTTKTDRKQHSHTSFETTCALLLTGSLFKACSRRRSALPDLACTMIVTLHARTATHHLAAAEATWAEESQGEMRNVRKMSSTLVHFYIFNATLCSCSSYYDSGILPSSSSSASSPRKSMFPQRSLR
jgi:hypothetical protein